MKIKMRTLMCGPKGTWHPGQTVDLALHVAQDLVNGGFATAIDLLPKQEEKREPKKPERKST